ncbi:RIP metalloprotease RseP [Domibacillus sp. DTU_2020_1001157_1_SI_ALB_TIR_016]|uniref:RIP metalloprotease RseP n=1 Tax=Domibacillus sp. DTU_2020_1001157_1_SI_ALB_TIR_016 TaxID=3077789 RepID=UPI0028ED4640|nr:RIP metalloprotease RseP [Domibacillus sp. DTU_2020_1001157_1_SI_ALB_TIR_016]WNS82198.1 RIP metalloprotease RseP [Domibacillus sp. DTU_2020_1001157_1_SI_ALB_TIR_016]
MNTVIAFIVIFGSLVFFHELGHYLFAKRAGILCREFAIGMGPKVFAHKKGETVWTFRLLPIGGYVRMAGEDPETAELKPGQRIGVVFNKNGEAINLILNGRDRFKDARLIEVENADLEHGMTIIGYEEGADELKTYPVHREALITEDQLSTQIAPYERQFNSKSLSKRAMAIFAGPLFNFILAFIIFVALAMIQGIPTNEPRLGEVTEGGAATRAGLQEGDRVMSINGGAVGSWEEIVGVVQENPGKELSFLIDRNGEQLELPVTPSSMEAEGETFGRIGVYSPFEHSVLGSFTSGAKEVYNWTRLIFELLGTMVTGQFSIDMLSGPVGIYVSTDTVAQSGVLNLAKWAGVLSINLGIMNLLPLPALDGGRLMFFLFEAVRGKPVDRKMEGLVHFVGFALLMLLMIIVTWNDIQRFFL